MKIALITDQHFGCRADNVSFLDYYEEFYSRIFFPELEKRKIKTVIDLGDTFDRRKYVNYNTLKRTKEMWFDVLRNSGIELHSIVGNHTTFYKNTNDVNSLDLLVSEYDNVYNYPEPKTINFSGHDILIMPWINNENYPRAIKEMEDSPAQVMFGHLEIAGALMDRGNINEHGMAPKMFDRFDLVCSGHFHHKSRIKNIEYLGCPYELTWIDYQDPKGFHIYDTETRELEFVRNPYSMFHKVFYSDDGKTLEELLEFDFSVYEKTYVKVIRQNCDNPYWFDVFMDNLYKSNPIHIQIVDDNLNLNLESEDDIMDGAEDTVSIMSKYITTMPESVPKKELDTLMRSLYNEAIAIGLN